MDELSAHQKAALKEPRDEQGHFIHRFPTPSKPSGSLGSSAPFVPSGPSLTSRLFPTHLQMDKKAGDDTLLDVHVGNPLRKITKILEEIKSQKAFSFTLKGSLGIAGVALALSTLGLFGGSRMLCDKGEQTLSGTLKVLRVKDTPPAVPILSQVINSFNYIIYHKDWPSLTRRFILVDMKDLTTVSLAAPESQIAPLLNSLVYATGDYDSCSHILKVSKPDSIEELH
jgi:hypothetical protein